MWDTVSSSRCRYVEDWNVTGISFKFSPVQASVSGRAESPAPPAMGGRAGGVEWGGVEWSGGEQVVCADCRCCCCGAAACGARPEHHEHSLGGRDAGEKAESRVGGSGASGGCWALRLSHERCCTCPCRTSPAGRPVQRRLGRGGGSERSSQGRRARGSGGVRVVGAS